MKLKIKIEPKHKLSVGDIIVDSNYKNEFRVDKIENEGQSLLGVFLGNNELGASTIWDKGNYYIIKDSI